MTPDGPVLALDTSTAVGSVAVVDGERILAEVTLSVAGQHSTALMPALDAAVRWAGLSPRDLRGVVVAGGPGSFTGLRIAAATAKGLGFALGVPLWSYSSLLAAAAGVAVAPRARAVRVCALLDARRRDVYAACYRFERSGQSMRIAEVFGPEAAPLEDVLGRFGSDEAPLFTGDAALLHRAEIERLPGRTVVPPHLAPPRASALAWLLRAAPERGVVADAAAWEPDYLRAAGAERIAAARESAG